MLTFCHFKYIQSSFLLWCPLPWPLHYLDSYKPSPSCPSYNCSFLSSFRPVCPDRLPLLLWVIALGISLPVLTDLPSLRTGHSLVLFSILSSSAHRTGEYASFLAVIASSALLPPLSVFSSALWRQSLEPYFPKDFFPEWFQLNSAIGDTYMRFEKQKKRRNNYSPVQF